MMNIINKQQDKAKIKEGSNQTNQYSYTLYIQSVNLLQQRDETNVYVRILDKEAGGLNEKSITQMKMLVGKIFKLSSQSPKIQLCCYCKSNSRNEKYLIIIGSTILNMNTTTFYFTNSNNKKIGEIACQIKVRKIKRTINKKDYLQDYNIFEQKEQDWGEEENLPKRSSDNDHSSKIIELSEEYKQTLDNEQEQKRIQKEVREAEKLVNESMRQSQDERKLFSKYLDQSSNFIQQLLSEMDSKPTINTKEGKISAIHEENDESNGQMQEHTKRHVKRKRRYLHPKSNYHKMKEEQSKINQMEAYKKINIRSYENEKNISMCRQFSEMMFDTKFKIKQLAIYSKSTLQMKKQKLLVKLVIQEEDAVSNIWPVKFVVYTEYALSIKCLSTNNKELRGTIDKLQQRKGQAQLFDENVNVKGTFYFKCKTVNMNSVQTQQIIFTIEEHPEKNIQKLNKSITCHLQQPEVKNEKQYCSSTFIESRQMIHKQQSTQKKVEINEVGKILDTYLCQSIPGCSIDKLQKQKDLYQNQPHLYSSQKPIIKLQQRQNHCSANNKKQVDKINIKEIQRRGQSYHADRRKLRKQQKSVNIKISQIVIKLQKSLNLSSKFIKLEINNDTIPYYTQTLKEGAFLCWKDKSFFFLKVPEWSILTIQLLQEDGSQAEIMGTCKVYIICLINEEKNGMVRYKSYLYDTKQDPVGEIAVSYEFFERNALGLGSLSSRLATEGNVQISNNEQFGPKDKDFKKYKNLLIREINEKMQKLKDSRKLSSKKCLQNNSNKILRKSSPLKLQQLQQKSLKCPRGCHQSARYSSGRNIIIPKQKRFKTSGNKLFYNPSSLHSSQLQLNQYVRGT